MTAPGPFAATSLHGEWTSDTLHQFMIRLLADMDLRYEQRFMAQNTAITAAMEAASLASDKATKHVESRIDNVQTHLSDRADAMDHTRQMLLEGIWAAQASAREEWATGIADLDRLTDSKFVTFRTLVDSQADKVALALASSDKAVQKAEAATERRFENMNEFRQQLSDQATTFMPRQESEQRTAQNTEKITDLQNRIAEINTRIDRREGQTTGHSDSTRNLVTIGGFIMTAVVVAITIFVTFHK